MSAGTPASAVPPPPPEPAQPGPDLWARQPGEGTRPFAAFRAFLAFGDERSNRRVARKLRKSATIINRWSARWRWQERLTAWLAHQVKVQQDALDAEARAKAQQWSAREQELRDMRWNQAEAMRKKAEEMMQFPVARKTARDGKVIVEPGEWNFGMAARMMETADKLAALAVGAPTDNTAVTGKHGEPIVGGTGTATVVIYLPEKEKLPA